MPYFNLFDDEQQKAAAQGQGLMQAFGGSPGSSSISPAQPPAQPAAAPSGVAGDSGSSFVNWERYQNANRDSAQNSANTVADSVQGTANTAAGGLSGLINQFNEGVGAATGSGPTPGAQVQTAMGGVVTSAPGASRTPAPGQMNGGGQNPAPAPVAQTPNRSSGGLSDPNAPAPAQPTTPAAGGPLTREDLVTGSQQQYRGPTSLAQTPGFDAVTGQITNAASQVNALGTKDGLGGLLAKNFGSGQVGSGANELDSALLGGAGRSRFGEITKGYGDLESRVGRAVGDSEALADKAKTSTDTAAGRYKSLLEEFDAKTAPGKPADAPQPTATKKKTFAQYRTGNEVAHTVQDIGNALDPTAWALHAAGKKSIEDMRAPEYEKQYGHPIGNSQAVRFERLIPGLSEAQHEALYNSLTEDELSALEQMSPGEQRDFAMARWKEVYAKAQADMKAQGF